MPGLLDIPGFDPSEFSLSEEERRRLLLSNILLGAGAGLSSARKGNEVAGLTQGLSQGGFAAQQALGAAQSAKWDKIKGAGQMMDYADRRSKFDEDQRYRAVSAEYQPPAATTDAGTSPAPQNAAGLKKAGTFEQMMARADYLESKGFPDKAMKYREEAQKFAPKLKDTKTLTQNGKRVTVNFYDDGRTEVLPDVAPDMEKAHFGSTGGMTNIPLDPFTGLPIGGGMPATMTPDQIASNEVARGNLGVAQAQLALARQKAAQEGGGAKPTFVNGQFVYAPDAQNPTGRAVTPQGLSAGEGKPLTESQAKATAFANQMFDASRNIAELKRNGFDGRSLSQQAAIVAAGSEGIPYIPGSGVASRAIAGKDAQNFQQAELQWTEGALRFMTGANAPEPEVIRAAATYFPRPGDKPEKIAQKEASRRNMEESVRMAAAHGADKLPGMPSQQQAPPVNSQAAYDAVPRGEIYTAPDGSKRRKQ